MPNWVFLAVPLVALCVAYWIYSVIQYWREQRYLHYIYDGDRIAWERSTRHNARQVKKLAAGRGGVFIQNQAKRNRKWISWRI